MDFRPWMIEAACDFIKSSRLLWQNNLSNPAMVNVGVGLEILFKSFNAEVDDPTCKHDFQNENDESYLIAENYKFAGKRTHKLSELFDEIPQEMRERLGLQTYRTYLTGKFDTLFVSARYIYEKEALCGGTDAIIEVAEEILDKIITLYKTEGCKDKWIQDFTVGC